MQLAAPTSLALLALLATACTPTRECGDDNSDCIATTTTLTTTTGTTATTDLEPTTTTSPTTTTTTTTTTTAGTPAELMRCRPTCTADSDCLLDATDIGFLCVRGQCGLPPCLDDQTCQQLFSGWIEPCTATRDCAPGQACIVVADQGLCATQPAPNFTCADLGLVELQRPAIEGRDLTVCGDLDATCTDRACTRPCKADADCPPEIGAPHCQTDTGQCTCVDDDECLAAMQPGLRVCLAGACGCSSDADCASGTNVDTCVAGSCGCSSTAACTEPIFDHVTQVCAP